MTCSKDSRVLFWSILGSKHEVKLKATVDMKKEQVVYNIIIFHLKVDMIFSLELDSHMGRAIQQDRHPSTCCWSLRPSNFSTNLFKFLIYIS